jgi:hypothetical protein
MSDDNRDLDPLLSDWPFEPGQPNVRRIEGADGRELLQMRVDMGLLQFESTGRPDGTQPGGCPTYYDHMMSIAFSEGPGFALNEERCREIDREFYQFYHRRICWLALKEYDKAVLDAEHTLRLMDFSSCNAPDKQWAMVHEQYRPFVLFHRTQAAALSRLEDSNPTAAVSVIDGGLKQLAEVFARHEAEEHFEDDPFVAKLREMRESVVEHFDVAPSLAEQLAEAIAAEEYERAAELRDRIGQQQDGEM